MRILRGGLIRRERRLLLVHLVVQFRQLPVQLFRLPKQRVEVSAQLIDGRVIISGLSRIHSRTVVEIRKTDNRDS